MSVSKGLIGIGYEGLTIADLVSRLRIRGVSLVVDVRLNAISRKRGFSKKALSAALADAGIDYLHRPALGNQRDNRAGYAETVSSEALSARQNFREALESTAAVEALEELGQLAKQRTVAVFCYEADQHHCHRQQVIEAVASLVPAG